MGAPLRDIKLTRGNDQQRASNLIGLDESGTTIDGERQTVVVAVWSARENDISLLRAMIQNDLQPFEHKSRSLITHGQVTAEERRSRVEGLISDLQTLPVSWAAVLYRGRAETTEHAAAAAMAAKKSITNSTGDMEYGEETALLHDGAEDPHSDYYTSLREHVSSTFDSGFQRNFCPVFLAFLQDADRIYPPINAADYIAGYVTDELEAGRQPAGINEFKKSWVDPAPQPEQPYELDSIDPIDGEEIRSRVLAWILGRGLPREPDTTTRDPYRRFVQQIKDEVVTNYLLREL